MENKKNEIRSLRGQGETIRSISQKTGVPRSSVHRIAKDQQRREAEFVKKYGDPIILCLPFKYSCPVCGKEQSHATLCPICAKFLPTECDSDECNRDGFDLSEVIPTG